MIIKRKIKDFIPKRRSINLKECLFDLHDVLPKLFQAFDRAKERFVKEVSDVPPESRIRGYEATVFNTRIVQSLQELFPNDWLFGKYRRFILRPDGYIFLVKKLNSKDMPMNIKTKTIDAIREQKQLSLFNDETDVSEPVLYFGYRNSRFGEISAPKVVYIDENKVKWTITEEDLDILTSPTYTPTSPVTPKVPRIGIKRKTEETETGT